MWFVEWLVSILVFPVRWFWQEYQKLSEEKRVWKLILLFVGSLSGILLIGFALIWLGCYLINYHLPLLVAIGLIFWLYAYVKSKIGEKEKSVTNSIQRTQEQLKEQADRGYPIMRNIMYKTLRDEAGAIGGIMPRTLQEIEILETHHILSNNIIYYQFKLNKADINVYYSKNELDEFKRILQLALTRNIQAGLFPKLQVENVLDEYGNIFDTVCVDMIEDIDTYFVIQTVFMSQAYANILRGKMMEEQSVRTKDVLNVEWNDIV